MICSKYNLLHPPTTAGITQVPEYSCETVPENDAALWPPNTKSVIDYWLQMGPESCRNRDGIYANSVRECTDKNRKLNDSAFFTDSPNGEKNDRHWPLVFSINRTGILLNGEHF